MKQLLKDLNILPLKIKYEGKILKYNRDINYNSGSSTYLLYEYVDGDTIYYTSPISRRLWIGTDMGEPILWNIWNMNLSKFWTLVENGEIEVI